MCFFENFKIRIFEFFEIFEIQILNSESLSGQAVWLSHSPRIDSAPKNLGSESNLGDGKATQPGLELLLREKTEMSKMIKKRKKPRNRDSPDPQETH